MFLGLQTLWAYSLKKSDFSDLGFSSKQVHEVGDPHFFYISDITNSSSFNGKICSKKSMLENFRSNVLKHLEMQLFLPRFLKIWARLFKSRLTLIPDYKLTKEFISLLPNAVQR